MRAYVLALAIALGIVWVHGSLTLVDGFARQSSCTSGRSRSL